MKITADNYTRALLGEACRRRFAFGVTGPDGLEAWRGDFRAALWGAVGMDRIAERCGEDSWGGGGADSGGLPRAACVGSVTLSDHVREDWRIETEPGFVVPFYLLRPLEMSGRLPLVLTPHGHGVNHRDTYAGAIPDDAESISGERDIARQAVREGYLAIAPQMRAFGDSRLTEHRDAGKVSSCVEWHGRALMFGRTLVGERVWDIMRLIDFALGRDDVDPARIMVTGNSGGGTVSLFAAALDPRISLAAPSCYFSSFADSIGAMHHCPCNYFPGMLNLGEMSDVAGLVAPRPLLLVAGGQDPLFPVDAARRSFEELRAIYHVAGAPDHCRLFVGDGGHRYYKQPVWEFAREHFAADAPLAVG